MQYREVSMIISAQYAASAVIPKMDTRKSMFIWRVFQDSSYFSV